MFRAMFVAERDPITMLEISGLSASHGRAFGGDVLNPVLLDQHTHGAAVGFLDYIELVRPVGFNSTISTSMPAS